MSETAYRVLARKYRPKTFDDLMGQDALVRTLTNAFETGRIAQAFILSGVRGVGKTTTARIIARALNCIGPDGQGGPTIHPCGVCDNCVRIAEDRHVDVLEMDAASRTGIDDIREIIESVRYAPASARYKVYIIDEVHMLSKAAFNGLLKTLEEPPPHVKFIFATTELHKLPVTVLSRCQRFDLKRIEIDTLRTLFARLAQAEGVVVEDEALALIARAAEGSARDGISLLDQAIAHGQGRVTASAVRAMLGLADRAYLYEMFEALMRGDAAEALKLLRQQYDLGADPAMMVQGLLEYTHMVSRLKLNPGFAEEAALAQSEKEAGMGLAAKLSQAQLSRTWQALLKGLTEVKGAPNAVMAAEMLLIRLAFMADLPTPGDIIAQLQNGGAISAGRAASAPPPAPTPAPRMQAIAGGAAFKQQPAPPPAAVDPTRAEMPAATTARTIPDLAALMAVLEESRDLRLMGAVANYVRPVQFAEGRIEIGLAEGAAQNLPGQLGEALTRLTGRRWVISLSREAGGPTWAERQQAERAEAQARALAHPLAQAALAAFPNAKIIAVREEIAPSPAMDSNDEE